MAREKDPNSVRQQAFKLLDKLTKKDWGRARNILKDVYSIGTPYADSLIAAHRRIGQKNGTLIAVYSIKDIKNGKAVRPYLKVEKTFHPMPDDCLTTQLAKDKYRLCMESKIAKALQL